MYSEKVSSDFPYESRYIDVCGSKIHYVEYGQGDPILLLHGMPTSSYIWRNIIPHLSTLGRCIAPDLIGMGKSDKPNIEYTIADHINYIEQFIKALNLEKITLVMHGWSSIMGIDYAMRHENNCKGLIFYEAYLHTLKGEHISLPYQEQLFLLQENSFDIVAHGARFVDQVLSQIMLRQLSAEELKYYRSPFESDDAGKPLSQYVKEISENNGEELNNLVDINSKKLMKSKLPKLLLYSIPGFITTIATVVWAKEHLLNLEIADVGEALHCAQETNPDAMGETMSIWLQGVEQAAVEE